MRKQCNQAEAAVVTKHPFSDKDVGIKYPNDWYRQVELMCHYCGKQVEKEHYGLLWSSAKFCSTGCVNMFIFSLQP